LQLQKHILTVKSYLGRLYIITRGYYSQTRANRHKGDEDKVTRNGPQVVDLTLDRSDEEVEEDEFQPHHLSDEEEAEEEEIFHADDERQDDLTNEDQLPGQASSPPRPPHSPISPVPLPIPQVTQLSRLAARPTHSTVQIPNHSLDQTCANGTARSRRFQSTAKQLSSLW
jgi:hypothetical protein